MSEEPQTSTTLEPLLNELPRNDGFMFEVTAYLNE